MGLTVRLCAGDVLWHTEPRMGKQRSRPPATAVPLLPTLCNGADENPTILKHDSGVLAVRDRVELVPRVTIDVEHECGEARRRIVHEGKVCRIGTHSANDVVLRDPAVSRFHCKLTYEEAGWRLQDSGSLNGTMLDDVRVRDADLGDRGVITLGDSVLRVHASEGTPVSFPDVRSFGSLVGGSAAMREFFVFLEKVAASEINVLIEGESGTGKELVAAELVQRGARVNGPFVIVDCGAISPNLVESELFGHTRGAFTGAERERVGAFETASGGTVFLEEVGELPLELQPKFLRALEAREIRRVGETKPRKVDVRVIAATNRDLEREVNKGRFREDLYFRLAVMRVRLPPLRERLDDLPLLIHGFLATLGVPDQIRLFPPQVLAELRTHDWPGNVRELRNYVERTVVLKEARLAVQRSEPSAADVDLGLPFKAAKDAVVDAFERSYVAALVEAAGGNVSRAARNGAMDRMYLHRLIQKHGIRTAGETSNR
jgi:DNA-binding NtrC family response regulator